MLSAYERADALFQCYILSLYVESNLGEGKIPHDLFRQPLRITQNGKRIAVVNPSHALNICGVAQDLSNVIKGSCFIAFDAALDQLFKRKPRNFPLVYSKMPEGTLRLIVYMMRCAFAHNPALPVWEVNKEYRNVKVLKIPEIPFEIDITQLDKRPLDESQHGQVPVLYLMKHCLATIKKYESDGISSSESASGPTMVN